MGAGTDSRLRAGVVAIAVVAGMLAGGAVGARAAGFGQAPASPISVSGATGAVALGDLNRDGNVDAVVVDPAAGKVDVLLGDGRGGLVYGASVATGGSKPSAVALADLNGDGMLDAAVTNESSHNLSLLLGNGAGGLTPAPNSPFITDSARPVSIVTGDFNGDGRPDVAAANNSSADVSVLLSNGSGGLTLAGPPVETGGDHAGPLAAGDFNGDGKLDVAVGNGSGQVSVLLGDGAGGLARAAGSPFGLSPAAIGAGDFNADGKLDVAVANTTGAITILAGSGTGALTPLPATPPPLTVGASPSSMLVTDINGDGIPDLAVASSATGDVSVLTGNGPGSFAPAAGTPVSTGGSSPASLAVADMNRDGALDLVAVNAVSATISVLLNGSPPPPGGTIPAAGAGGGARVSVPAALRRMSPFPIVRITGKAFSRGTRVAALEVFAPRGVKVTVKCAGKGCPFRRWSKTVGFVGENTISVKPLRGRFLYVGTTLEVRVYKAGQIGKYTGIRIDRRRAPTRKDMCLVPGTSAASRCPGV